MLQSDYDLKHAADFLSNSILSAIVDPAVPTKPKEAQLQTLSSMYRSVSGNM